MIPKSGVSDDNITDARVIYGSQSDFIQIDNAELKRLGLDLYLGINTRNHIKAKLENGPIIVIVEKTFGCYLLVLF